MTGGFRFCRTKEVGNEIESADFGGRERRITAAATARRHATPWGSYVRGDLSIVSTSNLPAAAQIDVANFSAALFASQITRLSYAESSLSRSLLPSHRPGLRV